VSCGVGCRRGSDPALLWLWRRLVATAPIQPLAWEPPYAAGAAQEIATTTTITKKTKDKKKENTQVVPEFSLRDALLSFHKMGLQEKSCIFKKVFILILPRGIQI